MADLKISALTAATSVDPLDLLPTVDVSDTTMNASGTTKKTTRELLQTYAAGTLTTDKKILDLSATWNAAGVTFTGFKLNVTDTASASGSLLLDVQKGGTSQLVLTKGGNLGLGVTPSASARTAIQVGANGTVGYCAFTTSGGITSNQYFNGSSHIYIGDGLSANYTQSGGDHFFYTAPTGTAGGTITYVERFNIRQSSAVFNEPGADYDFRIEGDTDANLFFVDASADRIGAGTNSPLAKIHSVVADATNSLGLSGTTKGLRVEHSSTATTITGVDNTLSASYQPLQVNGSYFAVLTSNTERMRLDSSGNLGLGVTPSAWNTNFKILETLGGSIGSNSTGASYYLQNAFYDSSFNFKYITTAAASYYIQGAGSHTWTTAPSGTAGNAITFTERFSIGLSSAVFNEPGNDYDFRIEGDTDANLFFVDASTDRVGIGTNTPAGKFHISTNVTEIARLQSSDANGGFAAFNNGSTTPLFVGFGSTLTTTATTSDGVIRYSANLLFSYAGSERMRLDSNGNALLGGTTAPTTGTRSLSIFSGTAPTATPADSITVYSSDLSAGNTMLSVYTEGTSVSDSTDNAVTKKIAVRINGTVYYLLADTDNS